MVGLLKTWVLLSHFFRVGWGRFGPFESKGSEIPLKGRAKISLQFFYLEIVRNYSTSCI